MDMKQAIMYIFLDVQKTTKKEEEIFYEVPPQSCGLLQLFPFIFRIHAYFSLSVENQEPSRDLTARRPDFYLLNDIF
jgi:hypothetical protein